jgi:RNA polymerase sigma factor (sigma-70 family)
VSLGEVADGKSRRQDGRRVSYDGETLRKEPAVGQDETGHMLRGIRDLVVPAALRDLTDAELVGRFVHHRDEAAFAGLVRRHARLVWGVCRQTLRHDQDAEDAFQAAFLVLARRASTLLRGQAVASWLYRVTYRIAMKARRARAARDRHHQQAAARPRPPAVPPSAWQELQAVLQEEVGRLGERYRLPFILCCLEGKTRAAAAAELGWKEGTVSSRLAHARKRLRARLTRRGIEFTAVLGALTVHPAVAESLGTLVGTTATAAAQFALRAAPADHFSPAVLDLAKGVGGTMLASKMRLVCVLAVACLVGAGALAYPQRAAPPKTPEAARTEHKPTAERDVSGDPLPADALVRLGSVRFRGPGRRLAFAADGRTLVAGGRSVVRWDLATGAIATTYRSNDPAAPVRGLAVSPDGKVVAAAGQDGVGLWDLDTGRELRRLRPDNPPTELVALSPDGRSLATFNLGDRAVRLWDVGTGRAVREFATPNGDVWWLAFSPDGTTLATAGRNGAPLLWATGTGEQRGALEFPAGSPAAGPVVFSGDGKKLLAAGGRAWDLATGKAAGPAAVEAPPGTAEDKARQAIARAEGLATGAAEGVALSPDGKWSAAAGKDGTVVIRDLRSGREVRRWATDQGPVRDLAFSPDGTLLASGADESVRVWDVATGTERLPTEGHLGPVTAVAVSPDGKRVASGSADRTVRLWDRVTGRKLARWTGHASDVLAVAFAGDGRTVCSCGADGSVRTWDAATHQELGRARLAGPEFDRPADRPVAFSRTGAVAVAAGPGSLAAWDVATGKLLQRWKVEGPGRPAATTVGGVAVSGDGRRAAASTFDGPVRVWDVTTGRETASFQPGYPWWVGGLAFSPDGNTLAVIGGGLVGLWDATTGKEVGLVAGRRPDANALAPGPGPRGGRRTGGAVSFSPDGRLLAAADPFGPVRLWDVPTRQELHSYAPPGTVFAFTPDALGLVAAESWVPPRAREGAGAVPTRTTLVVWDVAGPVMGRRDGAAELKATDLASHWAGLAADARGAYRAIGALTTAPKQAVPYLKAQLTAPPVAPRAEDLDRLIADLDAPRFAVREAATRDLEALGPAAEAALRTALAGRPSAEVRQRAEGILAAIKGRSAALALRPGRAIHVLELAGTPEARALLRELAEGPGRPDLSREAKAALDRLSRRDR